MQSFYMIMRRELDLDAPDWAPVISARNFHTDYNLLGEKNDKILEGCSTDRVIDKIQCELDPVYERARAHCELYARRCGDDVMFAVWLISDEGNMQIGSAMEGWNET